jgi:RNA polymerase sigma-70 factor (ECF subfamily)
VSPEPSAPTDAELVARCQAGDLAAFEPLVERYRDRVWRLVHHVLRDREEAWDCAQEAFVRAYQSLGKFRGQSAFYTWLFRIAMNLATDRLRARGAQARAFGRERVPEEEWSNRAPDPALPPDEAAASAERRARIARALESLPPKARTIIMLSDVEGLSYREIADVLDVPIGTVMSRLHHARKRLRAALPHLLVALWLVALAAAPAAAGDPNMVRFGVRVLQAHNAAPTAQASPAAPEIDERLQKILPRLRTLFRYPEYTTLERHRVDVTLGTQQRFPLPGARELEVTPDQVQGRAVHMRVRLSRGAQQELRATITAAPGAPAVLGGPPHGDGVLIIILWANPAPAP